MRASGKIAQSTQRFSFQYRELGTFEATFGQILGLGDGCLVRRGGFILRSGRLCVLSCRRELSGSLERQIRRAVSAGRRHRGYSPLGGYSLVMLAE